MDNLLSVEQVMAILGVGRTTAYQLIGSGEIKSRRIGHLVRVTNADLARFIQGRPQGKPESKRRKG